MVGGDDLANRGRLAADAVRAAQGPADHASRHGEASKAEARFLGHHQVLAARHDDEAAAPTAPGDGSAAAVACRVGKEHST